jgi:DNA replication protein DnaC
MNRPRDIAHELEIAERAIEDIKHEHLPPAPIDAIVAMAMEPTDHARALVSQWEQAAAESEAALLANPEFEAASARAAALAEELKRHEQRKRLHSRGVPARQVERVTAGEKLARSQALEAAHAWERSGETLLLLLGPPGTGKTTAAAWLCRKLGRFVAAADMARMSAYAADGVASLEQGKLLVIDDIGVEYADAKGLFRSQLDAVVSSRFGDRRRTVLTGNIGLPEWRERYGARLLDRAREDGVIVQIKGQSMRESR